MNALLQSILIRPTLTTSIVLGVTFASPTFAQRNTSAWAEAVHKRWNAELQADSARPYCNSAILVRFDSDKSEDYKANVRALIGDGWLERYTLVPGLELVHVRGSITEAVARAKPFVLYAEPDYVEHAIDTPNDPRFNLEWGLQNTGQAVNGIAGTAGADIRAPQAWDVFTGDPNFVIADIDSGMQYTHPDLAANVWTNPGEIPNNGIDDEGDGFIDDVYGWDFYSNDNDPMDQNGHGTHTAGTIGAAGNNGLGITGVNWHCQLMALRFLGPDGSGTNSGAISCVQYCVLQHVRVSNNSWGGGPYSQALYDAISNAKSIGHLFVCAAGNNSTNIDTSPYYPASFNLDNMIVVAATTSTDSWASFSNYGPVGVALGAPGDNVYSTWLGSSYMFDSGTSMATPHVTGVVALVYGLNPGFTYQQARYRILSTVRPLTTLANVTVTGGIVDAAEAVAPGSTMPGTPYCAGNSGDPHVTTTCPCANPGSPGAGCANSSATAGARLLAGGTTTPDTVVFTTVGEPWNALSIVMQGKLNAPGGLVFGAGVRCVNGNLLRLFSHNAAGDGLSAPHGGDLSVSARSAALGDPLSSGMRRYYAVYYREPSTSFCPGAIFNVSNGFQIAW
jgi:subtilisin family serine protease